MTTDLIGNTLPELGLDVALSSSTLMTAVVLGVVAVGTAPLLTIGRLRRMDIPGTLRVVE
jgi:putative ABC transport system permease protein